MIIPGSRSNLCFSLSRFTSAVKIEVHQSVVVDRQFNHQRGFVQRFTVLFLFPHEKRHVFFISFRYNCYYISGGFKF